MTRASTPPAPDAPSSASPSPSPSPSPDSAATHEDPYAKRASVFVLRLAWAPLVAGCMFVVGCALWLRADARGFGTHEQLGIPPCMFTESTHIPCPGCGLTTSFTLMAHLHPLDAFRTHPMGPLLFLVTLFVALYGPYAMVRARPATVLLDSRASLPVLGVTALAGLVTFALRVAHVLPVH